MKSMRHTHKFGLRAAMLATCLGVSLAATDGLMILTGNFHTVVAGELYRSAQPSSAQLESYVRQYGVRTVVNLRGAHPGEAWYEAERDMAGRLGVTLIDFPMSAKARLEPERARALLARLKAAAKPVLIHCKSGADRSGLVSLIYASQIAGIDEETAEWQLSPLYGHIGIPYLSPTFAMDLSWETLEHSFGI